MTRIHTFSLLALALAACTPSGDDFSKVLPDDRLLVDFSADYGGMARSDLGETSEYMQLTADVTDDINSMIGEVLDGLDEITSFDPTWTDGGTRALWGPWEDGGTNGRLFVEQHDDGSYSWAVQAKEVKQGENDWVSVFAGEIDAGATEAASTGRMAIDFGAISQLDPSEDITGEFYVEYAVDGDAATATAGFQGFSEDGGPMADVGYAYAQDGTGNGSMDLGMLFDEFGGPDPEMHVVRSRWNAAGEGRSDVYLTEGDFGALVYSATECWDTGAEVVFYEDNYAFTRNGQPSACAFDEPDFNEDGAASAR